MSPFRRQATQRQRRRRYCEVARADVHRSTTRSASKLHWTCGARRFGRERVTRTADGDDAAVAIDVDANFESAGVFGGIAIPRARFRGRAGRAEHAQSAAIRLLAVCLARVDVRSCSQRPGQRRLRSRSRRSAQDADVGTNQQHAESDGWPRRLGEHPGNRSDAGRGLELRADQEADRGSRGTNHRRQSRRHDGQAQDHPGVRRRRSRAARGLHGQRTVARVERARRGRRESRRLAACAKSNFAAAISWCA